MTVMSGKVSYFFAEAVTVVAAVLFFCACGGSHGAVGFGVDDAASVTTMYFDVAENDGKTEAGRFLGSVMVRTDDAGREVYREIRGADGGLSEWHEVYYDADGRPDSVAVHSVRYGADRMSVIEYDEDGDGTEREYSQEGELLRTTMRRNGRRSEILTTYPDGVSSMVRSTMRKGRVVRETCEWNDGRGKSVTEYEYDGDGKLLAAKTSNDVVGSCDTYDYIAADSCGNWTCRVKYVTVDDSPADAVTMEKRLIEYRH